MKFGIIAELARRYRVQALCQQLHVSRSGYYAWCQRSPSRRQQENERLSVQIRALHAQSRETWLPSGARIPGAQAPLRHTACALLDAAA
jgi:hypothetical protein